MKPLKSFALALAICGLCPFASAEQAEEPVALATVTPTTPDAFHLLDEARAQNEDNDLKFVRTLIKTNETALQAAKDVLKTSFDADIRMMAGDSMKMHDAELRTLNAWMQRHGPQMPVSQASASLPVSPSPTDTTPTVAEPISASMPPLPTSPTQGL